MLSARGIDNIPILGTGRSRDDERLAPTDFIYNETTVLIRNGKNKLVGVVSSFQMVTAGNLFRIAAEEI